MQRWMVVAFALLMTISGVAFGQTKTVNKAGVEDLRYEVGTFTRPSRLSPGGTVTLNGFTPINVLAYGVDNTGATSCTDSLQAVVDAVEAAGGGDIYMPPGDYTGVRGVTVTSRAVLFSGHGIPDHLSGGGPRSMFGAKSPVNAVFAPRGSTYMRSDDADSTFYYKSAGDDSTGWVCISASVILNAADIDTLELSANYNVKAYGATGDGTTDDTAAIQAAIDACEAAGGGEVYFPHGSYAQASVISCTGADSVTIRSDSATIVATGAITGAMFAITTSDYFTVKDIRIDGNGNAKWGFDFKGCSELTLDNVEVFDMDEPAGSGNYAAGIRIGNSGGTGGTGVTIKDCYIHDITSTVNNASRGIVFYTFSSTGDAYVSNITISGCTFKEISPVGDGDGLVFQQTESDLSPLVAPVNATVTGNVFWDCYKRGIKIQNRGVTVTGNSIHTTRTGTWGGAQWSGFQYAGISVYESNCTVSGNTFTASASGTYQYGIEVDGGSADAVSVSVTGNVIVNDLTATGESAEPWEQAYGIRVNTAGAGLTDTVVIGSNSVMNTLYGYWVGNAVDNVAIIGNSSNNATQDLLVYTPSVTIDRLIVRGNIFPTSTSIGALLSNEEFSFRPAYGHMYHDNSTETITFGASSADSIITNFTVGEVEGFSIWGADTRGLKVSTAGTYKITWSATIEAAGINQEMEITVGTGVSGQTREAGASSHATSGSLTSERTLSGNLITTLAADEIVTLLIRNETSTGSIDVYHANLSITRIK